MLETFLDDRWFVNIGSGNGLMPSNSKPSLGLMPTGSRMSVGITSTDPLGNKYYCQTSNISRTLVDNKVVDHSYVDGALPTTTSSFSK